MVRMQVFLTSSLTSLASGHAVAQNMEFCVVWEFGRNEHSAVFMLEAL